MLRSTLSTHPTQTDSPSREIYAISESSCASVRVEPSTLVSRAAKSFALAIMGMMIPASLWAVSDVVGPQVVHTTPEPTTGCGHPFCGFYAGLRASAGLAPSRMQDRFALNQVNAQVADVQGKTLTGGTMPAVFNGGAFFGVGKTYGGKYYVGAEASMGVSYTTTHQWMHEPFYGMEVSARQTMMANTSLKLGWRWDRTLFYLRAGYALGRWRLQTVAHGNSVENVPPAPPVELTAYQGAPLFGLGMEYALTDKLLWGVEASYAFFASRTLEAQVNTITNGIQSIGKVKVSPQTLMVGVSLTRQF